MAAVENGVDRTQLTPTASAPAQHLSTPAARLKRGFGVISLSRRRSVRDAAERAYRRVVEHARHPVFFTEFRVPDTLDGRYEMICLHAFLYLHRLKRERPQSAPLSQAFFDTMFADMDRGLRDAGTGDLSVGRQVKRMAEGFYGRIWAYEQGLGDGGGHLDAAVARNVFGTLGESAAEGERLACWVRRASADLASQRTTDLYAGNMRFPVPSVATAGSIAR